MDRPAPETYVCHICGRICKSATGLNLHMKKHDHTLFKCHADKCQHQSQKFVTHQQLLLHLQSAHPGLPSSAQWHPCRVEGRGEEFSELQVRSFELHMKGHRQRSNRERSEHVARDQTQEGSLGDVTIESEYQYDGGAINGTEISTNASRNEQHKEPRSLRPAYNSSIVSEGQEDLEFDDQQLDYHRGITPHSSKTPSVTSEDGRQTSTPPPPVKPANRPVAAVGAVQGSQDENRQVKDAEIVRTLMVNQAMRDTGGMGGLPRVVWKGGRMTRDLTQFGGA